MQLQNQNYDFEQEQAIQDVVRVLHKTSTAYCTALAKRIEEQISQEIKKESDAYQLGYAIGLKLLKVEP